MNWSEYTQRFATLATDLGLKVLGAIALWLIGGWLINIGIKLTQRAMATQKIDRTVIAYVGSTMNITLKILLVVGILGFFGIQTTTFAALLAAIGLAIGAAWSGLLANFAAGAFLIILRPFEIGDVITAGGVTGRVEEMGLFITTINTSDNVRTYIGNNKIFSDNIQNFSANPYRRIACSVQLNDTTDHDAAIKLLADRISKIPNVLPNPKPEFGISQLTPMGPVLEVKACCQPSNCGQVQNDTYRTIRETFKEAGYEAPKQLYVVKQ